jgi:hypothetical protein
LYLAGPKLDNNSESLFTLLPCYLKQDNSGFLLKSNFTNNAKNKIMTMKNTSKPLLIRTFKNPGITGR